MKRPKGKGQVYERSHPDFDKKVLATSFNGKDPGRRPKVLIEANTINDVINAMKRAREENLTVNIVSGGHSWAQNHIQNDGLLLSLSRFNEIEVDAEDATVKAGPGCWGIDLDRALRKHNLFFPVAHAPDVCLGGFLLQGGFGWASRELGVAAQSVIGIDVVLADGSLIHANEHEHSDLYWAARGAGSGFFGVIVRYHLKAHARFKYVGLKLQVFRKKHLEDVYRWLDDVGPEVSRSVELQLLLTPKAMGIFSPGIEVVAPVLTNSRKEAKEAVEFMNKSPIRKKASFTLPLIPCSTSFMANMANITHFPPGVKWCADNIWTDAHMDDLIPGLKKIAETMPPAPSHALFLNWHPPKDRPDMAFSLEGKRYLAAYGMWKKDDDDSRYDYWATDRMKEMEKFALGSQLADENLGKRPTRFTQDSNLRRLDEIRTKYDPEGLFRPWMGRIELDDVSPLAK